MARHAPHRHRSLNPGLGALRVLLAVVAVVAGAVTLLAPTPGDDGPAVVAGSPPAPVVVADQAVTATPDPVAVSVPSVGLSSSLVAIGVDTTGALVPPADYDRAGWFAAGPAPGAVGPAVLAGHVDSRSGPAVFFRLKDVEPGDEVLVDRSDGSTVAFTVTRVAKYPKTDFATEEVYGPTVDAQLRLITCGGKFDRSRRSYTDNIVVYATAT